MFNHDITKIKADYEAQHIMPGTRPGTKPGAGTPSANKGTITNNNKNVNSTNDNSQHSFRQPPTTDTSGRQLSKGQSEYFKNSAVRDGKGNLMVMYHGTPYGGFTQFKN